MPLPDCQDVGVVEGELVLTTKVAGGLLVSHACGFEIYRPGGVRPGSWTATESEEFIARWSRPIRLEL